MQTTNIVEEKISRIGELFPNCLTEAKDDNGRLRKVIDFEKLKQELSEDAIGDVKERYQFTWPDKRHAIRLSNLPITDTLRPYREESVNFDTTQNLYIEGDNLNVLKLLRENYLGKVKMIYIDPPYNTGGDFVYKDNFIRKNSDYKEISGSYDEEGNILIGELEKNADSNGRFHTDWLNMIYPRLKVAKDLLSEDGVIFISIDDNEVENLKKICDEIFGSSNFISQVVWERSFAPISLKKHFSNSHDYILVYGRNIFITECHGLPRTEANSARYSNPDNDPRGPWQSDNTTVGPVVQSKVYELELPSGRKILPPSGRCWLYTKERFAEMIADNRIWFGADGDNVPRLKRFLSDVKQGITPMSIWKHEEVGHSQSASQNLKKLFDGKAYFEYPKPVDLIERCIALYTDKDSLVLDFFSGSATTAHAVFKRNAEDEGFRKFIMVQLPEQTEEDSEAYSDGYKNICEIAKERIRRAGKMIKEESPLTTQDLDVGFRVLKLDSSNMEDVYYRPAESTEHTLFEDNIKPGRTSEDLLFQVMLECNLPLSAKIETEKIGGKEVFSVNEGYLMACFDEKVTENVIKEIAKRKPYYFVMRDSSLATDNVADNFEQIWQAYSKDTIRRIL